MTTFLVLSRLFLMALLGTAHLSTDRGYATEFGGRTDLLSGTYLACTGERIRPEQMICAHRSLPCGTVVLVQNLRTGRMAPCVVADRGPYGATLPNGEIILKVRPEEEGTWRGLIDLSPAVATVLGLAGRERVGLIYERPAKGMAQTKRRSKPAYHQRICRTPAPRPWLLALLRRTL